MFKILISPSKTFDLSKPTKSGERPVFIKQAKKVFKKLKKLSLEQTKEIYGISDELAKEVHQMHKTHGKKLYRAIDMYDGLVFKQLEKDKYDEEWVNEHVIILDALYGVIKPYDLISPYRLDFNSKLMTRELREVWKLKINEYLKDYELHNYASDEYASLIEKVMESPWVDNTIKQVKVRRGHAINRMLIDKEV